VVSGRDARRSENKLTYRWARKGSRPRAAHDQRTQSTYFSGRSAPSGGQAPPSYCRPATAAELNSQENIWQFMRQNWLSNRIFKSFDDIVDHCCYAWNTLIDQPWKIMSIAQRYWATVGHSL
jgi:hypothetical protein